MPVKAQQALASIALFTLTAVPVFVQIDASLAAEPDVRTVSQVRFFAPHEVDALVAPIALFPDSLLAHVLMATTSPYDVEDAVAWQDDPANATLADAALARALDRLDWDSSVKALTAAPVVLRVMNDNRDWSDTLGTIFAANSAVVMDAVQRLRHQAQAVGRLTSDSTRRVTTLGGQISIDDQS